jgi:predicted transcriptional regulator of viral defense system
VRWIHPLDVHPRGMDVRTVEKVVADLAESTGSWVARAEVARRLGLRGNQAGYWLSKLVRAGRLRRVGKGRGAQYEVAA